MHMPSPLPILAGALAAALFLLGCGSGGYGTTHGAGVTTHTPHPRVSGYVRGDVYSRLIIEVDSVTGFGPYQGTPTRLEERLTGLLDKPGGIDVVNDKAIASRGIDHGWTFGELRALANSNFDLELPANTTSMHVMFLDGHYAEAAGGTVLGIAWDNRHIAIFKRGVEQACGTAGVPAPLESQLCQDAELAIWLHEVGHVIGLVDIGLVMTTNHEDPEHPGHDHNRDCVMYWAYEGDALVQRLAEDLLGAGNGALDFDAECLADIAALRDG